MKIRHACYPHTPYGPGVEITLSGDEVAKAIMAFLVANGVHIEGPRTITVNDKFCRGGYIYVDPSGYVINKKGKKLDGRGPNS